MRRRTTQFCFKLCAATPVGPSAIVRPGDDARLEFMELLCNILLFRRLHRATESLSFQHSSRNVRA